MDTTYSVLVTGLGGQGVLLISKAIAAAALGTYPFACRTETRGLSQRGGSVSSVVRLGQCPLTPVIGMEDADIVLSLDLLEAARAVPFLRADGILLTNEEFVAPADLAEQWRSRGNEDDGHAGFSASILSVLRTRPHARVLKLRDLACEAHCVRAINTVMLGAASHFLPLPSSSLRDATTAMMKPQFRDANTAAFDAGRVSLAAPRIASAVA